MTAAILPAMTSPAPLSDPAIAIAQAQAMCEPAALVHPGGIILGAFFHRLGDCASAVDDIAVQHLRAAMNCLNSKQKRDDAYFVGMVPMYICRPIILTPPEFPLVRPADWSRGRMESWRRHAG